MRGRIQAKYKTFGALEAFTLMFVEWDQCEPKEHEYALDHSFRLMISGARMAVSYSENEKLTAFSNMRSYFSCHTFILFMARMLKWFAILSPVNHILSELSTMTCPEKAMATHSSTLAWKLPWTKELGRLQSMGSRRLRHD